MLLTQEVEVSWNRRNKKWFLEKGYLFTEYQDRFNVKVEDLNSYSNLKVEIICDICGEIKEPITWFQYLKTKDTWGGVDCCRKCGIKQGNLIFASTYGEKKLEEKIKKRIDKMSNLLRKSFDEVIELFLSKNYKILFDKNDYKTNTTMLPYICLNHPNEIQYTNFTNLAKANTVCKKCLAEEVGDRNRTDKVIVFDYFKSRDLIPIEDTEYINQYTEIPYFCTEHLENIQYISYVNLQRTKTACSFCRIVPKGKYHVSWLGGKNSPVTKARKTIEYNNWRQSVYKRDNYTCQCCGDDKGGNLQAHHIENFSSNKELRFAISNGITLCINCHAVNIIGGFHNAYGTRNNTKEQLEEYILAYRNKYK